EDGRGPPGRGKDVKPLPRMGPVGQVEHAAEPRPRRRARLGPALHIARRIGDGGAIVVLGVERRLVIIAKEGHGIVPSDWAWSFGSVYSPARQAGPRAVPGRDPPTRPGCRTMAAGGERVRPGRQILPGAACTDSGTVS